MNKPKKGRFAKEIKEAAKNNPHIDMDQIRKWAEASRILDQFPPQPESVSPMSYPPRPPNVQPRLRNGEPVRPK